MGNEVRPISLSSFFALVDVKEQVSKPNVSLHVKNELGGK